MNDEAETSTAVASSFDSLVVIIKMQLMCWVLASLVIACDYTLYAKPGNTNIWATVNELDPAQSPYILCLADSTTTKHFTMDDSSACYEWTTSHLVIQ